MGNLTLKLVKAMLIGSCVYHGAKAIKLLGYIEGYSDSAENIFEVLDMEEEEKRATIINHYEIASTWKSMKSIFKEIKNTIKQK